MKRVETYAIDFFQPGDIELQDAAEIVLLNHGAQTAVINDVILVPPRVEDAGGNFHPYQIHLNGAGLVEDQVFRVKFTGAGTTHLQIITRR